ncbi:clr5 domain-containing protein [Purpureocillium lavendulum]|uniref:Clr5 domain-containing protein n=1 Tax=Purpureocillium lavendulum TaxID=1247861 RepID=A0AB34G2D0_9HYPO|nr:clr5 domain-containing protein [Purpureocillium lavendulum]
MASRVLPVLAPRAPGSAPVAPERTLSREHTEAEWKSMKGVIEQLYINENRKLVETMAILESRHGFAATEQMYKKRLKKWDMRKRTYRKAHEGPGASTPAPSATTSASDADAGVEEVPRPGTTEPSEQQPLAIERINRAAGPNAGLELVLDGVFSWSLGKLDSHRAGADPMSRYLANPNQPHLQDSRTMYRTFELVFDLWYYGKGQLAGMAARKAFYALEFVLDEDHPDLVWHILDTVYDMVDRGHIQLLGMFLPHATALAARRRPAGHPLRRILEQLMRCDYQTERGRQQVRHMLRQAWLRNVHVLTDRIGSLTPQHLWLYEQLIWDGRTRLRKGCDLAQRREAMLTALDALQGQHESSSSSSAAAAADPDDESDAFRICALQLEYTQMDLGDRAAAERLARDLLGRTTSASGGGSRSRARFHAYARKMLARLQQDRQEWGPAEENLRWAVTKREAAHGADSNLRVIRDLWVLAAHFQRADMHDAAEQTTQDALARAARYLGADAGAGMERRWGELS